MQPSRAALGLTSVGVLVACLLACGEDRPPSQGSGTGTTAPPGSNLDGGNVSDGAASNRDGQSNPTNEAGLCNELVAQSPVIAETTVAGAAPEALGGLLGSGTFWLTERDRYGVGGEGPIDSPDGAFQSMLIVTDTGMQIVEGVGPKGATSVTTTTRTVTWAVTDATVFSMTNTCPDRAVTNQFFTVADDGSLWLFPTKDRRDVYTPQP